MLQKGRRNLLSLEQDVLLNVFQDFRLLEPSIYPAHYSTFFTSHYVGSPIINVSPSNLCGGTSKFVGAGTPL